MKRFLSVLLLGFLTTVNAYCQNTKPAIHPGDAPPPNFTSFPVKDLVPDDVAAKVNPGKLIGSPLTYSTVKAGGAKYVEVIGMRKADESYFIDPEKPSNFYLVKGLNAINYQKNGQWYPVDAHLKLAGDKIYEAPDQWEPVGINLNDKFSYIKTLQGDVQFNNWSLYGGNDAADVLLAKADWSNYTIGADGLHVHNIFPGIDAEMRVARGSVKTNFIVRKLLFPQYKQLYFQDEFAGVSAGGLHFYDRRQNDQKATIFATVNGNPDVVKILPALVYAQGNAGSATVMPYRILSNKFQVIIPTAYIQQYLSTGSSIVIDPQVTSTNSIAQSMVGTPYNASCTWTTACDYTISVTPPAAATITDVQDQVEVIATAPCGLENFGYQVVSGTCISPGAGVVWIANGATGPGTMWAGFYSEPNLVACMPAASCTPSALNVLFHLYRTCVGPVTPACDNTCLGLNNPLAVRIVGYTAQYASIAAYPADTTCAGNSLGIKALPQYGKPPYAATNWSFSSTGTPSIGTGDSISLGILPVGTYTVYANTTDACGTVLQTSKVVKVYPLPAVSKVTKTDPVTCGGTGNLTLYGLAASTSYIVSYTKNGTPAGPVTILSDASGALTIGGLTAGTYTGFQLTAHGCASGASALSVTLIDPVSSTAAVTGNPCTANVITMTANPSWAITSWLYNGNPVIKDTIKAWGPNGTIVAGGNGTGTALNQFATGPLGMAIDVKSNVYVADNNNHRVVKWQPGATAGILVAGGNGAGAGLNQFNAPYGVYADADSNVYVLDRNNHRVVKWVPAATAGVIVAGGNGAGAAANQVNNPRSVFVDGAKNIYITDFNNNRIMKWAPGAAAGTVVAGGNGAGAALNQLNQPVHIYVDASGNLYIADFANNRIMKWAPAATAGVVVAGGNGAGSAANQLNGPRSVRVDELGFIYIADQNNNRIQRWIPGAASGITIAGGNGAGAALNQTNSPVDLSVGADGAVYVLEQNNVRVTKFIPKATDTLVPGASGTYTANITSFNGCTNTANINWVQKDTVKITANPGSVICAGASVTFTATVLHGGTSPLYTWKVNGTVVSTAGSAYTTTALADRDVISCTFSSSNPCTVADSIVMTVNQLPAVTLTGNPCTANMIIMNSTPAWSINAWQYNATPLVSDTNTWNPFATLAAGVTGSAGTSAAQLNFPLGVFADAAGNVYVADRGNNRVQKWAPGATSGVTVAGGNGAGPAANQLNAPFAIFVDRDTNVYVMDWGNARVQRWAYGATSGTTVAGGNGGGSALNQINASQGLFVDANKNVYVADNANQRVVKWASGATTGILVAGGNGSGSGLNQFVNPISVYVDGANNLFVSDYSNNRVMKWAPGAAAGTVAAGGNGAGNAANQLNGARVSWLDGSGNIYVCDQNNNRIQRWRPGAAAGTTVAGGSGAGNALNQLNSPTGVFISNTGDIYTVEQGNHRALKFSPKPADTLAPTISGTYTATVLSYNGCSNTASINWVQKDTVTVTASPGNVICAGTSVTFTATVLHGGTSPVYVWKVNGAVVGGNTPTYTSNTLANNDWISCTFSSSNPCTVADSIKMTVNPNLTPSVSIALTGGLQAGCAGSSVTFTATPTNGGAAPIYQWQVNGVNAGTNAATFTSTTLANNDVITVIMTSSLGCVTSNNPVSNSITMIVAPNLTPDVFAIITTGAQVTCAGTSITFTAIPVNGGIAPVYQWQVNGVNTGTNAPTFTSATLADNDVVTVIMTSNFGCLASNNPTSNPVTMSVGVNLTPSVSIAVTTGAQAICAGTLVTFTATPVNGGTTPSYQWQVNGVNAGIDAPTFTSATLANNDVVTVIMTSDLSCLTSNNPVSNSITMNVGANLTPSVSIAITSGSQAICAGTSVTFTTTPTNGGTAPDYEWQVNGVDAGTNASAFTSTTLADNDVVTVIMTSNFACLASNNPTSNSITMTVGTNLTPSVSIAITTGSQIICAGTSVTFTATPANGGSAPAYQWQVNGVNAGTNSPTFTSATLANNDVVTVILTSNITCLSSNNPVSNPITMTVNPNLTPTVSIAITTGAQVICAGALVTFTATPVNGGTSPIYQWQVNGINAGANSPMFSSSTLINNDVVTVILTSNEACLASNNPTGNSITMTVNPNLTPAVSIAITTGAQAICAGTSVTFTATPTNGGTTPVYQWQVNGINAGTNAPAFTSTTLANNDVVTVIMTSNYACLVSNNPASNSITMAVSTNLTPSVSIAITTGAQAICAGTSVTFTATPVNGGTTPAYQWKINGVNAGTNSNTFTSTTLANGDIVTVVLTSNETCLASNNPTSNSITMTVNPNLIPSATIAITAGAQAICAGTSVTFTATPANGGTAPVYQWKINGVNAGTNSNTFTSTTLANGDIVTVVLTSNEGCLASNNPTSNAITMTVNPNLTPSTSIAITTGAQAICAGTSVTFTATPTNGGTAPVYQWKVNGVNTGTNSNTFTSTTLANGDIVTVVLTSSEACLTTNNAASNAITMTVNPNLTPSATIAITAGAQAICAGTSVTFTATPTNGGTAPVYQWKVNGVNAGTNSNTFTSTTLANGDIVTLILTSNETCLATNNVASNAITMTVNPNLTPAVSIAITTGAQTICAGATVTFTATPTNGGTAPVYQWKVNGVNTGTSSNTLTSSTLANGDVITVVLTSNEGCLASNNPASNAITMTVNPNLTPTVSISTPSTTVCSGDPATFTAVPVNGGSTPLYQWSINSSPLSINSPVFTYASFSTGDIVTAVLTSSETCVTTPTALSNALRITIANVPVLTLTADNSEILAGGITSLHAVSSEPINSYLWTPSFSLNNSSVPDPVATPDQTTLYTLVATSNFGCKGTAAISIKVGKGPQIANTFTPNNDGIHDTWEIKNLETYPDCRVQVFSRTGQLIFESRGYKVPWNGTYKGKPLPIDTYYYIIELNNRIASKPVTGYVTILK